MSEYNQVKTFKIGDKVQYIRGDCIETPEDWKNGKISGVRKDGMYWVSFYGITDPNLIHPNYLYSGWKSRRVVRTAGGEWKLIELPSYKLEKNPSRGDILQ